MVDPSGLGLRSVAIILAALTFGVGCGGGGKSEPEDLSSVATADPTVEYPDPEELSEDDASDDSATEAESTEVEMTDSEVTELPDLSPPPTVSESITTPETEPPMTEEVETSEQVAEEVSAEPSQQEPDDDKSPLDFSLTVIEPGEDPESADNVSLVEAAAAERARRGSAPPTNIVITNKNLSDYAVGQLTVVEGAEKQPVDDANAAVLEERRAEEEYWRGRALEIRTAWSEAAERADELEGEVFHLRQRFYAEDDGFYRDSQIKPAWDRAIEQLQEANREIEDRQDELAVFLEEGRTAGAMPGWLREGVDLEPEPRRDEEGVYIEPDRHEYEPGEPVVVDENGQEPGQ